MRYNNETLREAITAFASLGTCVASNVAFDCKELARAIYHSKSWTEAAGKVAVVATDIAGVGVTLMNPSLINFVAFGAGFMYGIRIVTHFFRKAEELAILELSDPSPLRIAFTGIAIAGLFMRTVTPAAFISGTFAFTRCVDVDTAR